MCAARRTTSTRLTRLAAKASPYHDTATLSDATEVGPSSPVTRRSRRVLEEQERVDVGRPDVDTDAPSTAKQTNPTPRRKRVKTETETDILDSNASPKKPKSKPTSKSKPKAVLQSLDAYNAIKEMRSRVVAPVDTMGCQLVQLREQDPKVG